MFTASSYGQVSLVQMLLDARAQVDAKNDDGPRAQIGVIASPSMREKLHQNQAVFKSFFNPNRISNFESFFSIGHRSIDIRYHDGKL